MGRIEFIPGSRERLFAHPVKGAWVDSTSFYEVADEKERLVLRNSADIELKLAAAIEREDSSVTSGLSSLPVQMNKSVFSLSVVVRCQMEPMIFIREVQRYEEVNP